jgi:hypothetical protein
MVMINQPPLHQFFFACNLPSTSGSLAFFRPHLCISVAIPVRLAQPHPSDKG